MLANRGLDEHRVMLAREVIGLRPRSHFGERPLGLQLQQRLAHRLQFLVRAMFETFAKDGTEFLWISRGERVHNAEIAHRVAETKRVFAISGSHSNALAW